jgi:hypothetical protein
VAFKLGVDSVILGGFTTIVKLAVCVKGPLPPVESVTWIMKEKTSQEVGVPEIRPNWLKVNPAVI